MVFRLMPRPGKAAALATATSPFLAHREMTVGSILYFLAAWLRLITPLGSGASLILRLAVVIMPSLLSGHPFALDPSPTWFAFGGQLFAIWDCAGTLL